MSALAELAPYPVSDWTKIIPKRCLVNRDAAILAECGGKSVLHVGAADAPFEMEKGRAGELLHQKISKVASRLTGVDVDAEAVQRLAELGIEDIEVGDIASKDFLPEQTFDVILCCDVIEHVLDPGSLLLACRKYMRPDSKLLVTTINATALKPAMRALLGYESVHCDHTTYFSYATLAQLLLRCGLTPAQFGVFAYPAVNPLVGWVSRGIMNRSPGCADGIVIVARIA
jgi:2-polyprenyl-3-methyl-5-hydroxy-6-metoxy-1,4-benzoquinol methylase